MISLRVLHRSHHRRIGNLRSHIERPGYRNRLSARGVEDQGPLRRVAHRAGQEVVPHCARPVGRDLPNQLDVSGAFPRVALCSRRIRTSVTFPLWAGTLAGAG